MGQDEQVTKPDVEAIIRQIKVDVRASELPIEPGLADVAQQDASLDNILADANRHFLVGQACPKGVKGVLYRMLRRAMEPLVGEVNRFNRLSIRAVNKLSKMLTGNDTPTESDLLAQTRRRIDLLTALGTRLDAYDALALDERLRRLEQRLSELPEKDAP